MRPIDADALIKTLNKEKISYNADVNYFIVNAPTIDPVKHGKWIKNEGRYGWHCSVCGEDDLYAFAWNSDKGEKELQDRYCPECGAKMERSEE